MFFEFSGVKFFAGSGAAAACKKGGFIRTPKGVALRGQLGLPA
jgi:hypothetical protein